MPTLLIATAEGRVARRIPLDPNRAYSIGRSPRCDIALLPGSISRRHAVLFPHAGGWWTSDVGSNHGLRTPAGTTRFAPLTTESWVTIGPLVLWLLPTDEPASRGEGLNHDQPVEYGPDDTVDLEAINPPAGEPSQLLEIGIREGRGTRRIDLSGVQHATIGSDLACAIRLPARPTLAPLHAVLVREPHAWALIAAQGAILSGEQRFLRKRLEPGRLVNLSSFRLRMLTSETLVAASAAMNGQSAGAPRDPRENRRVAPVRTRASAFVDDDANS